MASYKNFEDLPVWQAAAELYDGCDELLVAAPARLSRSFRDQLERAALSVSNNIAEGFERGTTNELLAFIYIARGSAGEVRSMLRILMRRKYMSDLCDVVLRLVAKAESCSRQLRAWADTLQNSDIKGQRHLNDHSKVEWRKRTDREAGEKAFAEKQKEIIGKLPATHLLRREWERKHGPM